MSEGLLVKHDEHEDVWVLKPEDESVQIHWGHYENSKAGLKKLINECVLPDYNTFYLVNRWYLTGEAAKRRKEEHDRQLSKVVWTDYPDVSNVPNYDGDETHGSETSCHEFKCHIKKKHINWNWSNCDYKVNPEVRKNIKDVINNIDEIFGGGKGLVINKIEFVHTHYYSSNERFVRIEVENVKDKKALKQLREEAKAKEIAIAKAEAEAEAAKKKAAEEARQAAIKMVEASEFGKTTFGTIKGSTYDTVVRFLAEGRMTEQFLNARKVSDLISEEQMKDKDYMRIAGILEKAMIGKNMPFARPTLIESIDIWKARKLAFQQGKKIKDDDKRKRRKAAANSIGAGFLAECF